MGVVMSWPVLARKACEFCEFFTVFFQIIRYYLISPCYKISFKVKMVFQSLLMRKHNLYVLIPIGNRL